MPATGGASSASLANEGSVQRPPRASAASAAMNPRAGRRRRAVGAGARAKSTGAGGIGAAATASWENGRVVDGGAAGREGVSWVKRCGPAGRTGGRVPGLCCGGAAGGVRRRDRTGGCACWRGPSGCRASAGSRWSARSAAGTPGCRTRDGMRAVPVGPADVSRVRATGSCPVPAVPPGRGRGVACRGSCSGTTGRGAGVGRLLRGAARARILGDPRAAELPRRLPGDAWTRGPAARRPPSIRRPSAARAPLPFAERTRSRPGRR